LDLGDIVFDKLPILIGLGIVIYAILVLSRSWREIRDSIRGWVILAFTVAIALLWVHELARDSVGGWLDDNHVEVAVTFIAASSWLSVIVAATGMAYKKYSSVSGFTRWMWNSPANVVTVMGAAAVGVIAYAWMVRPGTDPEGTGMASALLVTLAYLATVIAIETWMGMTALRGRRATRSPAGPRAGVGYMAAAWMGIPATEYFLHLVLGERLGVDDFNPYGWVMALLFMFIVRAYSHRDFTTIIVDSEVEDTKRSGFRVYDIPRGVYLLEDDRPLSAFALFSELVTLPLTPEAAIPGKEQGSATATLEYLIPRGLIVTRTFPEKVRKEFDIHVTPIIWLTESPGERRLAPTSVAVLTDTMVRFMEANPNSIVLLEGVEYLVTFNDFKRVLKALDSLNETTWVTKTRLIIAVDPKAFDQRDLALLERDRKVVRGRKDIDTLKKESRASLPEG
jgi:hypothetical protein